MREKWIGVRDALRRAGCYLDETAGLLLGAVDFTGARRWLDELLTILTEQSTEQDTAHRGARGGTARLHQLREKLRKEHMEPIAAIAQLTLWDVPEFVALRAPNAHVRASEFLASARAMARAAAIHKEAFVNRGLPPTFLDDLESAIATLEEAPSYRANDLMRRALATQKLEQAAKQGAVILRVLDALVRQAVGNDAILMRGWQAARFIRWRRPVSESKSSEG